MRPTPEGDSNKKGATHRWYHRRGGGCRPFILLQNPDHLDRVAALPASVRITGVHACCGLRQQQPNKQRRHTDISGIPAIKHSQVFNLEN